MVQRLPVDAAVTTDPSDYFLVGVDDSKVLTGPWNAAKQTLVLAPFDQIMSLACSGVETAILMEGAAKQAK